LLQDTNFVDVDLFEAQPLAVTQGRSASRHIVYLCIS